MARRRQGKLRKAMAQLRPHDDSGRFAIKRWRKTNLLRMLLLSGWLLCQAPAWSLTASDFAEGFDVTPTGESALQRVYLPGDVFRVAVRADLGDMRVFNRAGVEVAFGLMMQDTPLADPVAWRNVPLFPLPLLQGSAATSPLAGVDVQLAAGGTVVAIRGAPANASSRAWLLDTSGWLTPPAELKIAELAIAELEFAWTGGAARSLVALQVQASDDLATWQIVVPRAALARLSFGAHTVLQNRVPLPAVRARYLAVRLLPAQTGPAQTGATTADDPIELTAVLARGAPAINAPPVDVRVLVGALVEGGIDYDTGGRYPVQGVTIWPVATNDVALVRLLTRRTARDPWRALNQGVAYRVRIGGATRLSEPLAITAAAPRWLRVEKVAGSFRAAADVEVRIRWPRPTLVFLRQGEAPFTVAFGAGAVRPSASPLPALLRTLEGANPLEGGRRVAVSSLPLARTGTLRVLGGAARLTPPRAPLPWTQIALWLVLAVGVLVVAGMALRLLRAGGGGAR